MGRAEISLKIQLHFTGELRTFKSDLKMTQTVSEERAGVNSGMAEINLKIQLHFYRKIEDVDVRLKGDPDSV